MDSKTRKRPITRLLLIQSVLVIIAAAVAGESFFRISREYVTPAMLKRASFQYVPSVFARHVFPRKTQSFIGTSQWHHSTRHINPLGYRGRDFAREKPPGVTRIIFYGGSSVFDTALPEGEDWPHEVGRLLRDKGIDEIEIINAGIPGHASFDAVGRFFAEGHLFSPDYVVFYGAWNDMKQFPSDRPLLRQLQPYRTDKNPLLNYNNRLDQFLCENSQLYVRLRHNYYIKKLNVTPEGAVRQRPKNADKITSSALSQYRLGLETFVDIARNIRARPILITEARLATKRNPDNPKFWYAHRILPHEFILDSFSKADEIMLSVARAKGVVVIDAAETMTGKEEFFEDHIHLTPRGSNVLASIVAEELFKVIRDDSR